MHGAAIVVHALDATGAAGAIVAGPFTTDASGNWSGQIAAGTTGPFALGMSGGTYVDEATGLPVILTAGQMFSGLLVGTSSHVTPFTHATLRGVQAQISGGAVLATASANALAITDNAFGFDFSTTQPLNSATATSGEKTYAALLGGLSSLIDSNPALSAFASTRPGDLVLAVAEDMADGQLDGLDVDGSVIQVPTDTTGSSTAAFPALGGADLSALMNATNSYAAGQTNLGGISLAPGVSWNPSAPPPVGCEVGFSGSGLALLPDNCFSTTTRELVLGVQMVWEDHADSVQILAVAQDGSATGVATPYVSRLDAPFTIWNMFNLSGIVGIARSNGMMTFTNVTVPELTSGGTTLILNGTLVEP